ncbi:MAG: helicase-exonuclease AddAB subunit AddB [Eubacteriales bacterium]
MALWYITGRSGTGKTSKVYSQIKEALNRGEEGLILMVPEQFTLQAERDLIDHLGLAGLLNIEVLSLSRLSHKVFNEAGGLTRTHINEQGRHMVLRKILDDIKDQLTIYQTVSNQKGFIEKISDLLSDLKKHDIRPDQLLEVAEAKEDAGLLPMKLKDIARIYSAFNDYLEGRYLDSEDAVNLLIERMDKALFLRGARVWMDGFDYFAPQTIRVIEKLTSLADQVSITFTIGSLEDQASDQDIFATHALSLARIRRMARENAFKEHFDHLSHRGQSATDHMEGLATSKAAELSFLERELYQYPYSQYRQEPKNLELFAASNLLSEVEALAIKIIAAVRERGWRFNEMAVVVGDLASYGSIIKRVFVEYGIPYFLDEKREVINNPIVDCLLVSLGIIERGYRYEDVFKYLKTGFSGLTTDEIEELENYCLEFGIRGKGWQDPFDKGEDSYPLDDLNAFREAFIGPFKRLAKNLKGEKTVEGMVKALYQFLEDIKLKEKLEAWIEDLRRAGMLDQVDENAQIWNIVLEVLDQLVEILGSHRVSIASFSRILEAGFSSLKLGIIPTTLDQVLVGDIKRSKVKDIKGLFVIGCNDGVLPSIQQGGGLIDDEEVEILKASGIELASSSLLMASNEKFSIYTAFSKPSDYLYISYSLANIEGSALRPSILVDRMRKLFKGLEVKSDIIRDEASELKLVSLPNSSYKYMVERMRTLADGGQAHDLWQDVYKWYFHNRDWDSRRKLMLDGLFHHNQEEPVGQRFSERLYQRPIKASITRLEKYVSCPFAHFVRYGLRPRDRRTFSIEAFDMGLVFHQSIEEFINKLNKEGLCWRDLEDDQCHAILEDVMDDILPTYNNGVLLSTNRYKYLSNRLKRVSHRAIWLLTDHIRRSSFEPIGQEISFGENASFPPIEIELENGEKLLLEGQIDRADIYEEDQDIYINVIDYKSGSNAFDLSEAYIGLKLQLLVYLEALLNEYQKKIKGQARPGGIFYFKIDDPLINTREKAVELVEKEIKKTLRLKGLVLNDVNIIRKMDKDIQGASEVLPLGLKKDGSVTASSSVLDEQEFMGLLSHVKGLIGQIGTEIIKGQIKIEPIKKGNRSACTYCEYSGICQFDASLDENKYRNIPTVKKEDILEKLMPGKGEQDNA